MFVLSASRSELSKALRFRNIESSIIDIRALFIVFAAVNVALNHSCNQDGNSGT